MKNLSKRKIADIYLILIGAFLAILLLTYYLLRFDPRIASFAIFSLIITNFISGKFLSTQFFQRKLYLFLFCGASSIGYIVLTIPLRVATFSPNIYLYFTIIIIFVAFAILFPISGTHSVFSKLLKSQKFDYLIILGLALLAVHPWFYNIPWGHDTGHQLIATVSLQRGISNGDILPRWDTYYWVGSAHFHFYPWLSYYFTLPFFFIGFKPYQTIMAAVIVIFILSGFSMYYMTFNLTKNRLSSIISGLAYLFSGYHFVVTNYRVALAEASGFMVSPLVFLYYIRALQRRSYLEAFKAGCATTALFFLHSISAYIILLVLSLYTIIRFIIEFSHTLRLKEQSINRWLKKNISMFAILIIVYGTLFGLTAWWFLPFLVQINHVNQSALFPYPYSAHIYPFQRLFKIVEWKGMLASPGTPMYIGLALFLFGNIALLSSKNEHRDVFGFILLVSLLFVIDTTIYPLIPLIKYVQFPWRFLILTSLSLSFLVGDVSHKLLISLEKINFNKLGKVHVPFSYFVFLFMIGVLITDTWVYAGFPGVLFSDDELQGTIDPLNEEFDEISNYFLKEYENGDIFRVRDHTGEQFRFFATSLDKRIYFTIGSTPEWTPIDYASHLYSTPKMEGYFGTKFAVVNTSNMNDYSTSDFKLGRNYDTLSILRNLHFRPFIEIVENPNNTNAQLLVGETNLVEYSSNKIMLEVNISEQLSSDLDIFIVLKVAWFPDWQGWIDQQEIDVGRNSYGLITLVCSPGKHTILLKFIEQIFQGTLITSLFITLTMILYIYFKVKKRSAKVPL